MNIDNKENSKSERKEKRKKRLSILKIRGDLEDPTIQSSQENTTTLAKRNKKRVSFCGTKSIKVFAKDSPHSNVSTDDSKHENDSPSVFDRTNINAMEMDITNQFTLNNDSYNNSIDDFSDISLLVKKKQNALSQDLTVNETRNDNTESNAMNMPTNPSPSVRKYAMRSRSPEIDFNKTTMDATDNRMELTTINNDEFSIASDNTTEDIDGSSAVNFLSNLVKKSNMEQQQQQIFGYSNFDESITDVIGNATISTQNFLMKFKANQNHNNTTKMNDENEEVNESDEESSVESYLKKLQAVKNKTITQPPQEDEEIQQNNKLNFTLSGQDKSVYRHDILFEDSAESLDMTDVIKNSILVGNKSITEEEPLSLIAGKAPNINESITEILHHQMKGVSIADESLHKEIFACEENEIIQENQELDEGETINIEKDEITENEIKNISKCKTLDTSERHLNKFLNASTATLNKSKLDLRSPKPDHPNPSKLCVDSEKNETVNIGSIDLSQPQHLNQSYSTLSVLEDDVQATFTKSKDSSPILKLSKSDITSQVISSNASIGHSELQHHSSEHLHLLENINQTSNLNENCSPSTSQLSIPHAKDKNNRNRRKTYTIASFQKPNATVIGSPDKINKTAPQLYKNNFSDRFDESKISHVEIDQSTSSNEKLNQSSKSKKQNQSLNTNAHNNQSTNIIDDINQSANIKDQINLSKNISHQTIQSDMLQAEKSKSLKIVKSEKCIDTVQPVDNKSINSTYSINQSQSIIDQINQSKSIAEPTNQSLRYSETIVSLNNDDNWLDDTDTNQSKIPISYSTLLNPTNLLSEDESDTEEEMEVDGLNINKGIESTIIQLIPVPLSSEEKEKSLNHSKLQKYFATHDISKNLKNNSVLSGEKSIQSSTSEENNNKKEASLISPLLSPRQVNLSVLKVTITNSPVNSPRKVKDADMKVTITNSPIKHNRTVESATKKKDKEADRSTAAVSSAKKNILSSLGLYQTKSYETSAQNENKNEKVENSDIDNDMVEVEESFLEDTTRNYLSTRKDGMTNINMSAKDDLSPLKNNNNKIEQDLSKYEKVTTNASRNSSTDDVQLNSTASRSPARSEDESIANLSKTKKRKKRKSINYPKQNKKTPKKDSTDVTTLKNQTPKKTPKKKSNKDDKSSGSTSKETVTGTPKAANVTLKGTPKSANVTLKGTPKASNMTLNGTPKEMNKKSPHTPKSTADIKSINNTPNSGKHLIKNQKMNEEIIESEMEKLSSDICDWSFEYPCLSIVLNLYKHHDLIIYFNDTCITNIVWEENIPSSVACEGERNYLSMFTRLINLDELKEKYSTLEHISNLIEDITESLSNWKFTADNFYLVWEKYLGCVTWTETRLSIEYLFPGKVCSYFILNIDYDIMEEKPGLIYMLQHKKFYSLMDLVEPTFSNIFDKTAQYNILMCCEAIDKLRELDLDKSKFSYDNECTSLLQV